MPSETPVTLQFTEEMKGYFSLGQFDFEEGYRRGEHAILLHLTIRTENLDNFVTDPQHQAKVLGYIDSPLIGGRCPILKGQFMLLAPSGDQNRKTMRYRLFFENSSGEQLTLAGIKQVQNNPGPDLWQDTTTLFTNLYRGHIREVEDAIQTPLGSGILHISLSDFLHQLKTFRADAPSLSARLAAIEQFGRCFLGELWDVHGLPRRSKNIRYQREIPLHTLEGVSDAEVSTHYATTGDGLGISLLRFQRAPCADVVLLVPGLTASSDMFIMPEHKNLTQTLLDAGFTDVWTLDGRISNRHPYNLSRHRYNVDDLALYDNPAALATIRKAVGDSARIHIISHCLGALSIAMSLFGKTIEGIASVIANGVALTPKVNMPAYVKLHLGPFLAESVLGIEYMNPAWSHQAGLSAGKVLAKAVSLFHRECNVPECHMTSFMWGYGNPVLFKHENLHDITHLRTGDLFGGSGVNYYRHILKMLKSDNTAVKFKPDESRYRNLPDNYFQNAAEITTPILLVTGQDNALFGDSNVLCYQRLSTLKPAQHELALIPGYGHADVIIGKNAARDVFPRFIEFLRKNAVNYV
ncbi:alpha/beta fold hydrolase [Dechloromonas sp.]|uniref:alpha/beta hydrolase n=1 Tax=Dechloromonas sp. TaxID=1917218 RepID=UPI0012187B28|nr:alpha/beta fold hydrolase [Dechloromonas sp.]MBU3696035.1 alpha/beta hydrolase [Dechloromonas sp.]TEX47050.1 MAG: alpha/beta hydrolase [Rhodocyclaceae bacterium]